MPARTTDAPFIPGAMDAQEQLRTYHGFNLSLRYITLAVVVVLSLLVVGLCAPGGWSAGLLVAAVELAIGLYFARDRTGTTWQGEVAGLLVSTDMDSGLHALDGAGGPGEPAALAAERPVRQPAQ